MVHMAQRLGAKVQGDDLKLYGPDGEPLDPAKRRLISRPRPASARPSSSSPRSSFFAICVENSVILSLSKDQFGRLWAARGKTDPSTSLG